MSNLILDPYQEEGVQWLLDRKRMVLGDEVGLGKTVQVIEAVNRLGDVQVLVITNKSLIPQTAAEIMKFGINPGVPNVITTKNPYDHTAQWNLTNYEMAVRLEQELSGFDVLIVDEAHAIKNRYLPAVKGKRKRGGPFRTKAVWDLAKKAEYVWLLSGYPIRNRPDELWSMLHCLKHKDFRSYWAFVNKYLVTTKTHFGIDIGGVHPNQKTAFGQLLDQYMLRREKVILGLPPVSFEEIMIAMEPRQQKLYHDMEDLMMALINDDDVLIAQNVLSQLIRLRQIAADPLLLNDTAPSGKTLWMKEYLPDMMQDHKILIFTEFAGYAQLICDALNTKRRTVAVSYTGRHNDTEREVAKQAFLTDDSVRVLVGTTGAIGEGHNLQAANIVIFADLPWTPDQFVQAFSRAHRRGQDKPVHVITLLSEGSVDEHINEVLGGKASIIEEALATRTISEEQMKHMLLQRIAGR